MTPSHTLRVVLSGARTLRRSRLISLLAPISVASVVGACTMAGSSLLTGDTVRGCSSSAGSYYLSRSFIEVQVAVDEVGKKSLAGVYVKPKADRSRGYCLDFLASATSIDTFVVQKDQDEHLLSKITSNADDQSKVIAENIIQAVFVALSGKHDFLAADGKKRSFTGGAIPATSTRAFGAEYDPFNVAQTALVNDGLKEHGLCLALEGQDISDISIYCNQPLQHRSREQALVEAASYSGEGAFVRYTKGVLYRPRLPYGLYLFANVRPGQKLPGEWVLRETATVYLENKSPILAVGIDRTFFASRKTTLTFVMGSLQDITIAKTSELAGAVEIPLQIASSIAALPAQIVQVKIDQTTRRQSLIAAQDKLILAQRQLESDRLALQDRIKPADLPAQEAAPLGRPLPTEQNQCRTDCMAKGIPAPSCSIACRN